VTILGVTESALQDAVIELANYLGFMVHHCRPGRRADGSWVTAITGDPGYPDLCLVKPPRVLFVELKSAKGGTSMEQDEWLDALRNCPGVETYVFRPADWSSGRIERVLRDRPSLADKDLVRLSTGEVWEG
jgi:hypothetical protein